MRSDIFRIAQTVIVVAILAAIVMRVIGVIDDQADSTKRLTEHVIESRRLGEGVFQAQTKTTNRIGALEEELARATAANLSLRAEVNRLRGVVTAVSTTVGAIDISGSSRDTIPDGDFVVTVDDDPWVAFRIQKSGNVLDTSYRTRFSLRETDVEVLLPGGAKTHLFDVAIVSDVTGDTLRVPVHRTYVERILPAPAHRLALAPRVHGGAAVAGEKADPYLGASLLAIGPRWALARADAAFGADGPALGLAPVSFNAGDHLPLLTNLHLSAGWFVAGRSGFYASIGVVL